MTDQPDEAKWRAIFAELIARRRLGDRGRRDIHRRFFSPSATQAVV